MLDRHAVQELLRAGMKPRAVAKQFGVSRRTVERVAHEPAVTEEEATRPSGIGRPGVEDVLRERVRGWLLGEPELPPGEVCRRLRDAGTPLGLSTTYRMLAAVRQTIPAEVMVRFEGVAGEFAQFDFGQVDVKLTDGARRRLLASFEASCGVPLRVVFDNPRTVVTGRHEGRPIWNATLAAVAIDYGFTIELCTPRSPEQKGAVENLVGFVKRAFFRARRFTDLERDLPRQLGEWLVDANEVRPSRATHEPPSRCGAAFTALAT